MNLFNDLKKFQIRNPAYGDLLSYFDKVVTTRTSSINCASINNNLGLIINPSYFKNLSQETKFNLFKIRVLQGALGHIIQYNASGIDKKVYCIASEIVVWNSIGNPDTPEIDKFDSESLSTCGVVVPSSFLSDSKKTYDYLMSNDVNLLHNTFDQFSEILDKSIWAFNYTKEEQGNQPQNQQPNSVDSSNAQDLVKSSNKMSLKILNSQVKYMLESFAKESSVKSRSEFPANLRTLLAAILQPKAPTLNWRTELKRFIGNSIHGVDKSTRRKESRRFEENPGVRVEESPRLVLAVDTSGSMSSKDLTAVLREVINIKRTTSSEITIIECDAKIQNVYTLKSMPNISLRGGGGTSFKPVIEHVNENHRKYDVLIYFTDGYAPAPKKCYKPTFWLISPGNPINDDLVGRQVKMI